MGALQLTLFIFPETLSSALCLESSHLCQGWGIWLHAKLEEAQECVVTSWIMSLHIPQNYRFAHDSQLSLSWMSGEHLSPTRAAEP